MPSIKLFSLFTKSSCSKWVNILPSRDALNLLFSPRSHRHHCWWRQSYWLSKGLPNQTLECRVQIQSKRSCHGSKAAKTITICKSWLMEFRQLLTTRPKLIVSRLLCCLLLDDLLFPAWRNVESVSYSFCPRIIWGKYWLEQTCRKLYWSRWHNRMCI